MHVTPGGHRALQPMSMGSSLRGAAAAPEPEPEPTRERNSSTPADPAKPLGPTPLPKPRTLPLLPTPGQLIDLAPTLWTWNPSNPGAIDGSFGDAKPPNQPFRPGSTDPNGDVVTANPRDPQSTGADRSGAAKTAMKVGIGGGFVQNAIDVVRLAKKYPEALRAARFEPALGRLGRFPTALGLTALTRPDSRVIDPLAPRIASATSAGKSFTAWDEIAMKSSVLLGASLAGVQIASSVPNLIDAVSEDGAWYENLGMTTSGRAGMLQLGGGTLGAGLFYTALRQTKATSTATNLVGRLLEAGKAPIMAKPMFGRIGTATALVVMANELGFLDSFNAGEKRPFGTVLSDAAQGTAVLNAPALRTSALLGAGAIIGFKAHRAIAAAGGVSGLGRGQVVGGAIVAGLLGAQLLGGLSFLDARD